MFQYSMINKALLIRFNEHELWDSFVISLEITYSRASQ